MFYIPATSQPSNATSNSTSNSSNIKILNGLIPLQAIGSFEINTNRKINSTDFMRPFHKNLIYSGVTLSELHTNSSASLEGFY